MDETHDVHQCALNGGLPGGLVDGLEGPGGGAAGVGDEDVDATPFAGGGFDEAAAVVGFRDGAIVLAWVSISRAVCSS